MRYYDQKQNYYNPDGSCNVTSLAMALSAIGINKTPDDLYQAAQGMGLEVTEVQTLIKLAQWAGAKDDFTDQGTFKQIKKAIALERPVILHGYFTGPGHIIAVKGCNEKGLLVNDPWGEWYEWGYDNSVSGEGLLYSYGMIARLCSPESVEDPRNLWIHQLYI